MVALDFIPSPNLASTIECEFPHISTFLLLFQTRVSCLYLENRYNNLLNLIIMIALLSRNDSIVHCCQTLYTNLSTIPYETFSFVSTFLPVSFFSCIIEVHYDSLPLRLHSTLVNHRTFPWLTNYILNHYYFSTINHFLATIDLLSLTFLLLTLLYVLRLRLISFPSFILLMAPHLAHLSLISKGSLNNHLCQDFNCQQQM